MKSGWDTGLLRRSMALRTTLDYMRWIAATIVVASHTRALYFMPREAVPDRGVGLEAFYFVSRMGQEAVVLFFVMSGFLIGGKFLSSENRSPSTFQAYLIARTARLALVAVPAVIVAYLLLHLGFTRDVDPNCMSSIAMVGNMLFLQDIVVPPLCNDPPLWSLANEYWYYVLFPLIVFAIVGRARYRSLFALLLGLMALIVFDKYDDRMVLLYFPLWMIGIFGWHRSVPVLSRWLSIPILVTAMFFARAPILEIVFWAKDYIIGVAAVLVLKSFATEEPVPGYIRRIGTFMASFSFSLYTIHYALLLALRPVIEQIGLTPGYFDPRQPINYVAYFALILLSLSAGYLFYFVTERHTVTIRRWIMQTRLLR